MEDRDPRVSLALERRLLGQSENVSVERESSIEVVGLNDET